MAKRVSHGNRRLIHGLAESGQSKLLSSNRYPTVA